MSHIYTNQIEDDANIDTAGSISLNDIVMLNGNNIVHSIDAQYSGINPIPSFDLLKDQLTDIRSGYLNLSGDNAVSGANVFSKQQVFIEGVSADGQSNINAMSTSRLTAISAVAAKLSAQQMSADLLSVKTGLSTDFGCVINTKDGKLSSIHDIASIDRINKIYRLVDDIIVETGLKDAIPSYISLYTVDLNTLVNDFIIDGIIYNKRDELEISEPNNPIQAFIDKYRSSSVEIFDIIDVLGEIIDRLSIVGYSLQDKLHSIENGIDALENNLSFDIENVSAAVDSNRQGIDAISGVIAEAAVDYTLKDGASVSVITALSQSNGKVDVEAKQLVSSDVAGLEDYVAVEVDSLKGLVEQNYLPLSGGTVTNSLSIAQNASIGRGLSVGLDSRQVCIGGESLCSIVSSDSARLSVEISSSVSFEFDPLQHSISLAVAGNQLSISTARLEEARMLSTVQIIDLSSDPKLRLVFKTLDPVHETDIVDIPLASIAPIYQQGDGISIVPSDDTSHYTVSADETIARRADLSAMAVESLELSDYTTGYVKVISSLSQTDGKIAYGAKVLAWTEISGLTSTVGSLSTSIDSKLDNNGNVEIDGSLSVTNGLNVMSSLVASGGKVESNGANGAVAIGRNAVAKNEETFVWSAALGDETQKYYGRSDTQGTFSINPKDGLSGVFIGEDCLFDTLSTLSGTSEAKISGIFDCISSAVMSAGIDPSKDISSITLANVISCLYFLGQGISQLSSRI